MCICVYTYICVIKNVSHYDMSVQSMSVMSFKNKLSMGWVIEVSSIQFLDFFNLAKPLICAVKKEQENKLEVAEVWMLRCTEYQSSTGRMPCDDTKTGAFSSSSGII